MAVSGDRPPGGREPPREAVCRAERDHGSAEGQEEDTVAEMYNGYCVKCKEKRDFEGEVKVSDSGRRMAQGTCPVCGTKMNRILGKA